MATVGRAGVEPVEWGGLRTAGCGAREWRAAQNLMLPIMPAMFVVSSLIVGATVEDAR